jgi:hypothetical protein
LPIIQLAQDDDIVRVAGRNYVCGMAGEDDLQLGSISHRAAQVPHQRVLKLGMEVCLRLLDYNSRVKRLSVVT